MDLAQDIFSAPRPQRIGRARHAPPAISPVHVLTALARARPPVRDPTAPRASPSSASPY